MDKIEKSLLEEIIDLKNKKILLEEKYKELSKNNYSKYDISLSLNKLLFKDYNSSALILKK